MKRYQIMTFLIFYSCLSCVSQIPTNSLLIPSDTLKNIKTEHFQKTIKQDSIRILRFDTIKIYSNKNDIDEVLHYLDFKVNNPHKRILQKININEAISEARKFMFLNQIPRSSVVNPYNEILGTYIAVRIYKDNYCMDNDITNFYCITDSLFIFRSREGYEGHSYYSIKKENRVYVIEMSGADSKNRKIEIKLLHDKFNSIIWRETYYLRSPGINVRFNLLIPAKSISNIPVLYSKDSFGLIESFNGFDKISLEELFNK